MTSNHGATEGGPAPRVGKSLAIAVSALLLAIVTAIGSGLGDRILSQFDSHSGLVSHSEGEVLAECGTLLYVIEPRAKQLASGQLPTSTKWETFRRVNHATIISPDVVEVSIQGESDRTITLTRIDFSVKRRTRPAGATFANPCGGPGTGRFVEANLDRDPVVVSNSGKELNGEIGASAGSGHGAPKQIHFPWTVSLRDPLLLYILADTKRCYCTWRAGIHWRSGAKSGVMAIDNGGKGYSVVGTSGRADFIRDPTSSAGWKQQ